MARPIKKGLDYFPLDVDWDSDRKLRWIVRKYKTEALAVIPVILAQIYSDEGYFVEASDRFFEDVSFSSYVEVETVRAIVTDAIDSGFFDRGKFEEFGILTSHGIQRRYLSAKRGGTSAAKIAEEHKLTTEDEEEDAGINPAETGVIAGLTGVYPRETGFLRDKPGFVPEKSHKEKKSKEKDNIINNIIINNKQTNKQESAREDEGSDPPVTDVPEGVEPDHWNWAREVIRRRIWERGMARELIDAVTLAGVRRWLNQDTLTGWLAKARHERALFEESRGRVGRQHRWETIRSELAILYREHDEDLPAFGREHPEPEPDRSAPIPPRPTRPTEDGDQPPTQRRRDETLAG